MTEEQFDLYGDKPADDRRNDTTHVDAAAKDQIRAFVERIERMDEERKAIVDDIKSIYAEAKGNGFDVKIIRKVVRIRKQDRAKRQEEEAILDLYLSAIGEI
jgi:uncharacterized protein (UPF0335 family)